MIQEIEPRKLDNQYRNQKPKENDLICCFMGDKLLVERSQDDELKLLDYQEVMNYIESNHNLGEVHFRYLFSIDKQSYFLLNDIEITEFLDYHYESLQSIRQSRSKEVCFAAFTAYHLYGWYRDNRYCGRCGNTMLHDENERSLYCPECSNRIFPKIAPAVIVAVTKGDKLLLTKYNGRAYKNYALIAGFAEIGETLDLSESRVSQMHSAVLARLRNQLERRQKELQTV